MLETQLDRLYHSQSHSQLLKQTHWLALKSSFSLMTMMCSQPQVPRLKLLMVATVMTSLLAAAVQISSTAVQEMTPILLRVSALASQRLSMLTEQVQLNMVL